MRRALAALVAAAAGCASAGGPGAAQTRCPEAAPGSRCVVVAGPHYAASPPRRWLFGEGYRALWTEPVEVPVLDLEAVGGGLRPVEVLGHYQSRSLALEGADGRAYTFRSTDKDTARLVTDWKRRVPTITAAYRDTTAALLPAAPALAAPLARAAGVLQSEPQLGVMPDDPRLGSFRDEFAGRLGTLEEFPTPAKDGRPGTFGAVEIIETQELFERLDRDPDERVVAEAYLQDRLVDFVIGDVDRHPGQWRWARSEPGAPWVPIAEDRDMAFVRYGGILLRSARPLYPILGRFGEDYELESLRFQGRGTDPRLLASLDRAAWRAAVARVQARLHPGAIAGAVARLPEAWRRIRGAWLEAALRHRVATLPEAADAFYETLAAEVEVHATDADEEVEVAPAPESALDVRVATAGDAVPRFERRFSPRETGRVLLCGFAPSDRVRLGDLAGSEVEVETRSVCPPRRTLLPPGAASGGETAGD